MEEEDALPPIMPPNIDEEEEEDEGATATDGWQGIGLNDDG